MDDDLDLGGGEVRCAKCGDICCIDGEDYKCWAWCDTCDDYAEGFDGAEYFMEQACAAADALRDREREGV